MSEIVPGLTMSNEDYLEAILQLSKESQQVRSVDVAEHLQVSKASVSKAMGILRTAGLIEQEHYGLISLTPLGKEAATEVLYRHKMLKFFLTHVLKVSPETAEMDACRMEHTISKETRDKWFAYIETYHANHKKDDCNCTMAEAVECEKACTK